MKKNRNSDLKNSKKIKLATYIDITVIYLYYLDYLSTILLAADEWS